MSTRTLLLWRRVTLLSHPGHSVVGELNYELPQLPLKAAVAVAESTTATNEQYQQFAAEWINYMSYGET